MSGHADPGPELSFRTGVGADERPITVRAVGADPWTAGLASVEGFDVETVRTLEEALESLARVDCVVCGAVGDLTASDLAAAVRERAPSVPLVLLVDGDASAVAVDLAREWTDAVCADVASVLLPGRVARLVSHHRLRALSRRTLAALDGVSEGVAVVGPDGDVAFANAAFARQFDYAPGALVGRDWRDLYTDESVERIESEAFPSATEGWRWLGCCVGRRRGGDTITVRIDVDALDDGSKVFRASDSRPPDGE